MKKILLLTVMIFLPVMNFINCSKDSITEPVEGPTLAEKLQEALDNGLASFNGKQSCRAVIFGTVSTLHELTSAVCLFTNASFSCCV